MSATPEFTPSLRLAVIADPHFADTDDRGGICFRLSGVRTAEAVDCAHLGGATVLVALGDLKDQDAPADGTRTLEYLGEILRVLRRFRGDLHLVIGNHDIDSLSRAQYLSAADPPGGETGAAHYAVDRDGWHLVFLDGCFRADGSPTVNGHLNWTDATIPTAQVEWLRRDLASGTTPTLVFVHQRLDPAPDPRFTITNADDVRGVMEASRRVRAVFQGHDHGGGRTVIRGIPYYTVPSLAGGPDETELSLLLVTAGAAGEMAVRGFGRAAAVADNT